jgi:hypothetical protein
MESPRESKLVLSVGSWIKENFSWEKRETQKIPDVIDYFILLRKLSSAFNWEIKVVLETLSKAISLALLFLI